MTATSLEKILFEPLSWIHPQWLTLSQAISGIRQQSIINQILIECQGWQLQCPTSAAGSIASLYIRQWHQLPQVALLLASQCCRAQLAYRGQRLQLPGWIRPFADLNMSASVANIPSTALTVPWLITWGSGALQSVTEGLPLALSQRVPLLFPPALSVSAGKACYDAVDIILMRAAFQYAKRNPSVPASRHFWRQCYPACPSA